jgi:exodeoxyribonuclease-3
MKLISWNVNGVRAVAKKGFSDQVKSWKADFICLQETKAQVVEVRQALADLKDYEVYANSAVRKGYSGTGILTRHQPDNVMMGIGKDQHDQEGRVLTLEYKDFYLLNVYVPNSGSELARLDYRQEWDADFKSYLNKLQKKKPVIACGDFNVAHQPIDLARPKENYNKTSGYTQQEIDGMNALLKGGFTDTYRALYPDKVGYSWWSARFGARQKNIGWRIDYFLVSNPFMPQIRDSYILPDEMGSDHCPVVIELK